jgi:hypothetical protein
MRFILITNYALGYINHIETREIRENKKKKKIEVAGGGPPLFVSA